MKYKKQLLILLAVGCAICLKWYLANQRIYIDEAVYSWWLWRRELENQPIHLLTTELKHPLYFYIILLSAWIAKLHGLGAVVNYFFIQKAFSVIAYFVSAYGVSRLVPNRRWWAASLFLLSPFIAIHTDFGIVEPLLIVTSIWVWVATYEIIHGRQSWQTYVLFIVCTFGLSLTKTNAAIPLLASTIFFFSIAFIYNQRRFLYLGCAPVFGLLLTLYIAFNTQVSQETTRVFSPNALLSNIPSKIAFLIDIHLYFLPITLIAVALVGLIFIIQNKSRSIVFLSPKYLYLLTFIIGTVAFFFLTDLIPRYSLFQFLPLFLLLVTSQTFQFFFRLRTLVFFLILDTILFISLYTLPSSPRITLRDRNQYRTIFSVDYNTQLIAQFQGKEKMRVHTAYYSWADLMLAGSLPLDWHSRPIEFWTYSDLQHFDTNQSCLTEPKPVVLLYGYSERTPDYNWEVNSFPGREIMQLGSGTNQGTTITYRRYVCN